MIKNLILAVILLSVLLLCYFAVRDTNIMVDDGEIDISSISFGFILTILLAISTLILLVILVLNVLLGESMFYESTTTKKFISDDNKIIDGNGAYKIRFKPILNGGNKVIDGVEPIEVEVIEKTLSTSKTIALLGSIAMLLLFMGFGAVTMLRYLYEGSISEKEMGKFLHFLLGGSVLFIPYIINKIFDSGRNLTKKK